VISLIFLTFFAAGTPLFLVQIFRKDPVLIIGKKGVGDRFSAIPISRTGFISWDSIKSIQAPDEETEAILEQALKPLLGENALDLNDIATTAGNIVNKKLMFPHSRKSIVDAFRGMNHIGLELKDRKEFLRNKNRYLQWKINLDAKTVASDVLIYYAYMEVDPFELYFYLKGRFEKYK